ELGVNPNTVYARLRSARVAFERSLRRHRARERRGAWAVVFGPRRWLAPVGVGLIGSVALAFGTARCGADDSMIEHAEPTTERSSSSVAASSPSTTHSLGADTLARSSDEPKWQPGGAGFSNGSNAKGERYT